jgi:hypothetical protein
MVILHPDGLQFGKPILLEVGHGFYVFAVEVVLHDVVEHLALGFATATDEFGDHEIECFVGEFVELQVASAVF